MENAATRTPRSRTQNIGDTDISYLVYETDGPPLVFLHATGFMPWLWHPIARELAPPYRAIAPYFCDHRPSDPNNGGLGWRTMAQDFAAFCKSLSLDRPFLVGHSMGATVLVLAEALFGLNTCGMVLIEPIFLPEPFYSMDITVDQHPLAAKAIKRLNFWADREDALAYVQSRGLFKKWDKEVLDLYVQHGIIPGDQGGLKLTCSPQREAALFMGGRQHNPWPEPAKIAAPVLVVEGETSDNRAFIDLEKVTSLLPQGRYRLIKEAGHLIPMEKPQVITEVIRDFFSTC